MPKGEDHDSRAEVLQSTKQQPLLVWASPPALAAAIGFPDSCEDAGGADHVLGDPVYPNSAPGHFLSSRPLPLVNDDAAALIPFRGWKHTQTPKDVIKLPPGWEGMSPAGRR
jgi:hypothetical protein